MTTQPYDPGHEAGPAPGPAPAQAPPAPPAPRTRTGGYRRGREAFRAWRASRPFWAGVFTLASAVPIMYFPYNKLETSTVSVTITTMAGAASLVIGVLLVALAMVMWFQPAVRVFAGVATLVLALVSFVTSNLGGFLIGLLLAVLGGGMSCAWAYDDEEPEPEPAGGDSGTAAGEADAGLSILDEDAPAAPAPRFPADGDGPGESPAGPATTSPDPATAAPEAGTAHADRDAVGGAAAPAGDRRDDGDGDDGAGGAGGAGGTGGTTARYAAFAAVPLAFSLALVLPGASPSDPLPVNPFADGPCASATPSASSSASSSATPSTPASASGSAAPASRAPSPSAVRAPAVSGATAPAARGGTAATGGTGTARPVAPAASGTPGQPGITVPGVLGLPDLTLPLPQWPGVSAPQPGTPVPQAAPAAPVTAPPATAAPPATGAPATAAASAAPVPSRSASPAPAPTGGKATATASPSPSGSGKPPYPCPSAGPVRVLAAEAGDPVLPERPWVLSSSLLAMAGMDYQGVVDARTASGTKRVLKFTVSGGIDIWNLDMVSPWENDRRVHVTSRRGSKSYMDDGTVTLYVESIKGNLFGLIPVEFTPDTPPPIDTPAIFFTDATVRQAGQTGARLTIPGMLLRPEAR